MALESVDHVVDRMDASKQMQLLPRSDPLQIGGMGSMHTMHACSHSMLFYSVAFPELAARIHLLWAPQKPPVCSSETEGAH
jgi:hypothetical protein